jgi:cbb3-type cytochrome oxidase maturation protein
MRLDPHPEKIPMNVLVYLVPLALALGLAGLGAFVWSMKAGQFDDLEGAAHRILDDDDVKGR